MAKKKAGDQRGALMALRQIKMHEGELNKLDGQQIMLEKQKMTIRSTHADLDVIKSLQEGNQAIKSMNDQMDVNTIAELQDDMEENMQEVRERQEMFAGVAEEDREDLLAELDAMEADALGGNVEAMEVEAAPINAPVAPAAELQPAAAQSDDMLQMLMQVE